MALFAFVKEFCQMKTLRTVYIVLTKAGLLPTWGFYKFLKSLKYYFAIFTDFTKIK